MGYSETFVYNNNFLQEKTVYSKALKRISEKAIYKRLSKNDTAINSVILTDLFNNSSSIDTINYKGQIIRIVYNGSQSNRDEYTYLSKDSMMLVKFRKNEVAYFEKSSILFGEFVPYIYDDKKYGVKGEIYFDKVTHTTTEKVIDLDGNVTIISFNVN